MDEASPVLQQGETYSGFLTDVSFSSGKYFHSIVLVCRYGNISYKYENKCITILFTAMVRCFSSRLMDSKYALYIVFLLRVLRFIMGAYCQCFLLKYLEDVFHFFVGKCPLE